MTRTQLVGFACLALLGLAVLRWESIFRGAAPSVDPAVAARAEVVLYATSWCGYCAKARALLDANRVDYTEYDIEKSAEGEQRYQALGGAGVPLLVINGQVVHGYHPSKILRLIGES